MKSKRQWLSVLLVLAGCAPHAAGVCDGHLDEGEECDDGNDDPADGCDCRASLPVPPIVPGPGDAPVVLDEDGAWCWFQDERAVFVGDRVFVSSMSHAGDVQVASYDLMTGKHAHGTLHGRLERDDHDAASLLPRADGRLMAFYTRHDGFSTLYQRTMSSPGDVSRWGEERQLDFDDSVTYSNPFVVPGDTASGGDRLFVFFRGLDYNPTYISSDDGGATWSKAHQLLDSFEREVTGTVDHRPYVKYVADGKRIHFFYSEGHPSEFGATSLYHLYYEHGELHRSDGTYVADLSPTEGPALDPTDGTLVHDAKQAGAAWVWDTAIDRDGHPVVVFSTYPDVGPGGYGHGYRFARWDGARWQEHAIARAGSAIYHEEPFYSGGIALDPDDPSIVYFSSNVQPMAGGPNASGHFELYRGVTADGGASWTITPVTSGSLTDNLRPIVPAHHPTATAVLWLEGSYESYFDWSTRVVGLFGAADARVAPPEPHEPLARVAAFDLGGRGGPVEPGFTAAAVDEGRAAADMGGVHLVVSHIDGVGGSGKGDTLHRDFVYRDAGGTSSADKLRVELTGLIPGRAYIVRLHGHDAEQQYLRATLWYRADAEEIPMDASDAFLGAHQLGNGTSTGDGHVDLVVTADARGAIALVARGLDDVGDDAVAVLNGVEVFARPPSTPVACFAVGGSPGCAPLGLDLDDYRGQATQNGLSVRFWTDRAGALHDHLLVARDSLVVDLDGLTIGKTYEITVHASDPAAHASVAARWRLDAPGAPPITARSFQLNTRKDTPFTFYLTAGASSLRLRAQDVVYSMSADPSEVLWNGLDVREVSP